MSSIHFSVLWLWGFEEQQFRRIITSWRETRISTKKIWVTSVAVTSIELYYLDLELLRFCMRFVKFFIKNLIIRFLMIFFIYVFSSFYALASNYEDLRSLASQEPLFLRCKIILYFNLAFVWAFGSWEECNLGTDFSSTLASTCIKFSAPESYICTLLSRVITASDPYASTVTIRAAGLQVV